MNRIGPSKFGFLRMTLAACVGIPLIIASNAFAQNPPPSLIGAAAPPEPTGAAPAPPAAAAPAPPAAEAERIIVTGSNIPTAEEVGPNPVDTYNRENLNISGRTTTYGADAVAGVVNLKMRHDYNGAEARIEYGNTLDKDSGLLDSYAIFGVGKGDTNITGVLNYYHRNAIFNHDRGFSLVPPFLSSNNSPYNLQLSSDVAAAAGGKNLHPGGTAFASAPDFTNGLAPANRYLYNANNRVRAAGGLRPGFNFNLFSSSLPESERYGVWLSGDQKVFGDQMVVYADGFYQNVTTHNELAAPATGSFETKGQTILAIPPHSPIAPGSEPPHKPKHAEAGAPADAFNPFNPFEQIISGGTRARLAEFGNRLFDNETNAWLSTIGIKGDKLFNGTWGYDAAFRRSEERRVGRGTQVSASRFNPILNQAYQ